MDVPDLVAQEAFDLAGSDQKMWVRVLAPGLEPDGVTWACEYSIGAPLAVDGRAVGQTSLLALVEALRAVSRALYGSAEYKNGRIGAEGSFKGNLFFPATADMLGDAPYPF